MILKRKPRDLNPLTWLAIAERLRYAVDGLEHAITHMRALGSHRTTAQALLLRDKCKDALSEAERVAKRLGA